MAEAPRKITIKLRPVGAKAAAVPPAAAPTPAVDDMTPIAEEAQQAKRQTSRIELPEEVVSAPMSAAAPTSSTIKLKRVTPTAAAPAAAPEVNVEETAQQAKRQTSRIELSEEMVGAPMATVESEAPTIKLKPVAVTSQKSSEAAAQAAKSKTARIELDSVLGGIQSNTPLANTTQKTIRLKKPATASSGAAQAAASAPMSSTNGAGTASEAKTIKLNRPKPTLSLNKKPAQPAPDAADGMVELETLSDEDMATLPGMMPAAPVVESTGAKVFTIIAIVAAVASLVVLGVLCGITQKHAASPDGSLATGNTLHSLPFERLF